MENTVLKTERILTVKEFALKAEKSERWIRKLIQQGKLKAITVNDNGGEQYRIPETALKSFVPNYNITLAQTNYSITPSQGAVCTTSLVQTETSLITHISKLPAPFSLNRKPVSLHLQDMTLLMLGKSSGIKLKRKLMQIIIFLLYITQKSFIRLCMRLLERFQKVPYTDGKKTLRKLVIIPDLFLNTITDQSLRKKLNLQKLKENISLIYCCNLEIFQ